MSYKIVFLDIDGTILSHGKRVSNATQHAIKSLQDKNITVVAATGRAPYFAQPVVKDLGIDSIICFNGSHVTYKGDVIHQNPIPKTVLEKINLLATDNEHPVTFLSGTEFKTYNAKHPYVIEAFMHDTFKPTEAPAFYWRDQNVYQLFLHCDANEEAAYIESIPELQIMRWNHADKATTCDVFPRNVSKAEGINRLLQLMELSPQEAIAFGDGLNDIEMLSLVGMGVAMGNAKNEVKAIANMITKSVDEEGVCAGLTKLGLI